MTGIRPVQPGDLVATRAQDHGNVAKLHDVAVVLRADRAPPSPSAAADLSNVIPFARSRRTGSEPSTPPVTIGPADRPAAAPPGTGVAKQIAVLVCSLAVHGVLLYAFWQEPTPLPSIGTHAISVEIMAGDNRPAGVSPTSGQQESQPLEAAEEVKPDDRPVDQEHQRVAEAREVKPDEKQSEVAKEAAAEQPKEQPPEPRQEIAMVETPQAETPTALPRETPPDMSAIITPPREPPKELRLDEPKAKQPEQKKAEQKENKRKKESRAAPATPADTASGFGKKSAPFDSNYRGRVSAHLQRHKQTPAGAGGATGSGKVRFWFDGSGRVTSVSVTRSTGAAVLDQEMMAMVRRASPFPAPPDGRVQDFDVVVNFHPPADRR